MPQPFTKEGPQTLLRIQELVAATADQIPRKAMHQPHVDVIVNLEGLGSVERMYGQPPTTRASLELYP